jgi:hypothetical protein
MQKFLEICRTLGLDNVGSRSRKIRLSTTVFIHDTTLFLIAGMDFIHNPSDLKFDGINQVFVQPEGAFPINIGASTRRTFSSMLSSPAISVGIEGASSVKVHHSPALMVKAGGVRAGGAGNYNLQTQALEFIVTDGEGLKKQSQISDYMAQMVRLTAGGDPAGKQSLIDEMKDAMRPYWGGDLGVLGLT